MSVKPISLTLFYSPCPECPNLSFVPGDALNTSRHIEDVQLRMRSTEG